MPVLLTIRITFTPLAVPPPPKCPAGQRELPDGSCEDIKIAKKEPSCGMNQNCMEVSGDIGWLLEALALKKKPCPGIRTPDGGCILPSDLKKPK